MNSDIIQGKWEQVKGEVIKQWGKLTDDTMTEINGNRTKLLGKIQETYGVAQDEAERQVSEWEKARDKSKAA